MTIINKSLDNHSYNGTMPGGSYKFYTLQTSPGCNEPKCVDD